MTPYEEGARAFNLGFESWDNPYSERFEQVEYEEWSDGWWDEYREHY